jgi:YggT family protein
MIALIDTLLFVLQLCWYIVIAAAIMNWLLAFGVINRHNRFVLAISDMLERLTEPVFNQIRRLIPPFSGVDISPLIVLIIIYFLQRVIVYDLVPYARVPY